MSDDDLFGGLTNGGTLGDVDTDIAGALRSIEELRSKTRRMPLRVKANPVDIPRIIAALPKASDVEVGFERHRIDGLPLVGDPRVPAGIVQIEYASDVPSVTCRRCARTVPCKRMRDGTIYRPFAWTYDLPELTLEPDELIGVCPDCIGPKSRILRDVKFTMTVRRPLVARCVICRCLLHEQRLATRNVPVLLHPALRALLQYDVVMTCGSRYCIARAEAGALGSP